MDQPMQTAPMPEPNQTSSKKKYILAVLGVVAVAILAGGGWFLIKKYKFPSKQEGYPALSFISPRDGDRVKQGELLIVKIATSKGVELKDGVVLLSPITFLLSDKTAPYEFEVKIPDDRELGPLKILAMPGIGDKNDKTKNREVVGAEATVEIEAPSSLTSINPIESIVLEHPYSPEDIFSQKSLQIEGVFADGKTRNITQSSRTKFTSSDEAIVTVSIGNPGSTEEWLLVRGKKAGKAVVTVSYENQSIKIPVEISSSNSKPVAEIEGGGQGSIAGLPTGKVGVKLVMNGSKSYDPDGDSLTYEWQLARPDGSNAVIQDADKAIAFIIPDKSGRYAGSLKITDSRGLIDYRDWAFEVAGANYGKATLTASKTRVPADGNTKVTITATLLDDKGKSIADEPLFIFRYYQGKEVAFDYCTVHKTNSNGTATFELFTESKFGPTELFVKAGACNGTKLDAKVTVDFY